jgi:hypothetical protein
MNSPQQRPGFMIYRPVLGIDDSHLIAVRQALIRRGEGSFEAEDVDALFRPASKLRAGILRQGELQRLYRHYPHLEHESTATEITNLASRVVDNLGHAVLETVQGVALLPSTLHPPEDFYKKTLAVAVSQTVKDDREIAKNTVRSFFGLTEIPDGIWYDDDYAASAHLARSNTPRQLEIIKYLNDLLMIDEASIFIETDLPGNVELGPVAEPDFNFNLID